MKTNAFSVFYYERFLFLQNRQNFHKRYDFVLARGSEDFEKYAHKVQNFNGFKVIRNPLNAFKILTKIKLKYIILPITT